LGRDSKGAPLATLEGHQSGVYGALALEDGRILSWSGDGTLRLWDSNGGPLSIWAYPPSSITLVIPHATLAYRFWVCAGKDVILIAENTTNLSPDSE
jgi:WD40 repeat protein